jgi:hypothetical protein
MSEIKRESENSPEKIENNLKKQTEDKESKKTKDGSSIDPEILENLSPELGKQISMMVTRSSYQGPLPNPLIEKLTEEHITKIIDASIQDDDRSYKFATSDRYFTLIYIILGLGIFLTLFFCLINKDIELLKDLLKIILGFITGGLSGYGFKTLKDNKRK